MIIIEIVIHILWILVMCVGSLTMVRDLFRIRMLDAVGIIMNGIVLVLVAGINVRANAAIVRVLGIVGGGIVARRETDGAIMLSWAISRRTRT